MKLAILVIILIILLVFLFGLGICWVIGNYNRIFEEMVEKKEV
jgi:hypothetical protein